MKPSADRAGSASAEKPSDAARSSTICFDFAFTLLTTIVRSIRLIFGAGLLPRRLNAAFRVSVVQAEGIAIAAETVAELAAAPGVGGTLIAPVTGRTNALAASVEQTEIIASVLAAAGVTPPTGEEATSWAS